MSRPGTSTFIDTEARKQKPRIKSAKKEVTQTSSPRKKSSPRINKSFACYNVSSKIFKYAESNAKDRNRNLSIGSTTPCHRKVISMRVMLNSSAKFSNGHPCPKELEESKQVKLKKEQITENLEKASKEVQSGSFDQAMQSLKRVFKEDSSNLKALYLKAQCFMGMKEFKLAIPDLLTIIQDHPSYSRSVYIDVATCFIESKDYTTAIRQLTRGLLKFPKFAEGFISRGTLYNQLQKWDKAMSDFYEALSIAPGEGNGYLGLADSLIGIGDCDGAIKMLDYALKCPASLNAALLKRGKLLFDKQSFDLALEDFQKLIGCEAGNVEAHYYKAFCLLGQHNLIDAAVALEQVIKYDGLKKFTGPAIYNLGAIKIKQRDFYGAHFTFQRAVELGLEIEEQKVLRSYVDSILCLVRRNFKEGVAALTKLIKKKHVLIQEYMSNCLAYRGYAYSSLDQHDKAVKDLLAAQKLQELDNASQYNLLISQAFISKDQDEAIKLIKSASDLFPKNIEPLEYKAAIYFQQAVQAKSSASQSKELLDLAVKIRDSDSDLYFYRGIVLYYNNKTIDAVYDFEKAIEKAEDNVASHFLARGLCSARLKMYKEAIQDFSICIQLEEKLSAAHLFRARCLFLIEDFESAHSDFQKALELAPSDLPTQSQVLDFLMLAGSLDEAIKTCEEMCSASPSPEAYLQKAKCLILQEKIDSALKELHNMNAVGKSPKTSFDSEVISVYEFSKSGPASSGKALSMLSSCSSYKTEGNICRSFHVNWLRGCLFMYLGEIEKAKAEFSSVIVRKKKKEQVMEKNNAELIYNLAVCYVIEGKYEEALQQLLDICNFLDEGDRGKVLLLVGILKYALNQNREAKSILTEAFKYDPDIVGNFLEEKNDLEILPLDCESSFLKNFSGFKVTIGDNKPILLKPSIGFPRPNLCNFEFNLESEILKMFSISLIKSKPETPWLNRVKGSIQFTDEIQHIESESIFEEPEVKSEESDVFSEKSLRKFKSLEIMIRSPVTRKKSEDFDSSLSEILDDIDDLNF